MSAPVSEILPWDSAFFGFPAARLPDPRLGRSGLERALADLARRGVKLVYWSADPDHAEGADAAAAAGGFLADTRLTFRRDGNGPPATSPGGFPPDGGVSPVRAGDSEAALLALSVRAGLHSRFRADPRFPPALFRSLYEEWMRKSLSGAMADAVLVARLDASVAGMVTVSAREGAGSIGLIAVDAGCEGRGLGSALVEAAGRWCASRGCASIQVVTQERNAAACALYRKRGYALIRREHVWHFWPGG